MSCCFFPFLYFKMMMMAILEELNLVSKRCSLVHRFRIPIRIISHYFPFLEELDISFLKGPVSDIDIKALSLALPRLRKVNLSGNRFINNSSLFHLCNNCKFLEQLVIFAFDPEVLNCDGIASAIRTRPNLTSLSISLSNFTLISPHFMASVLSLKSLACIELPWSTISDEMHFSIAEEGLPLRKLSLKGCRKYTYDGIFRLLSKCKLVQHLNLGGNDLLEDEHICNLFVLLPNFISINLWASFPKLTNSSFFALTGQCPLLTQINMAITSIGGKRSGVADSLMDRVVNSQMKSICLCGSRRLRDEDIKIFAFICPNLQLLDLRACSGISKSVVEVLKKCPKIRYLNLSYISEVQLFGVNFQAPVLEELNLSNSRVDDRALFII